MDPVKVRYLLRAFLLFSFSLMVCGFVGVCLYLSSVNVDDGALVNGFLSNALTAITIYAAFLKFITSMKGGIPESDMLGTPTINNTPNASPIHYPNYQATNHQDPI